MNYYQLKTQRKAVLLATLSFLVAVGLVVGVVLSIVNGSIASEERIEVVSVYSETEKAAKETLENIGLQVEIFRATNIQIPKGLVYEQDPRPGAKVNQGEIVSIYISEGGDRRPVPQVVGFEEADAERILTSSEYGFFVETATEDSPALPGVVLRQDPVQGELLGVGETIRIFVSSGTIRIPDLRGQAVEMAIAQLEALGLTVTQELFPSDTVSLGFVINSRPGPNSPAGSGEVVLFVSSGVEIVAP